MAIMALEIEGYTYVAHKLINRPWGPECRFTVARPDGSHINEVIPISSMSIADNDLVDLIVTRLARIKAMEDDMALYHKFEGVD
jgi:hypothetical protein